MTDKIDVEIDATTAKAVKALNDLIDKLGSLNASGPQAAKAIDAVERSAVKIATSLANGTKSVRQQTAAINELIASYRALSAQGLKNTGSVTQRLNNSTSAAATQGMLDDQQKAYSSYFKNIEAAQRNSLSKQQQAAYQTYANNMPAALKQTQDAAYKTYASNIQATKAITDQRTAVAGLANQRYALYSIATTWGIIAAATLGASAAVVKVGIDYQKSFATVQRTVGGTQQSLANLKEQLIGLSTTLPVTFDDITKIATLGGQLGIKPAGIEKFTEVVAKLTATTNLTADAAGTALGRFQALFGTASSEFDNIASAILKVGVNSVATETQIVNTSTQISSMGKFAGLTAEQVVGLSGALASVGAAPELARGTVTRLFTNIATAVQSGGTALDEFARVSGLTSAQFKASWDTPQFAQTFQSFLKGIASEGQNAIGTLHDLGISSVRDVPLLLRLAGAGDVVTNAFNDAATGFKDGTELNRQYAITAGTVAAKLQTLANTLKAIFAAPGSAVLGPLAGLLDVLEKLTHTLLVLSNSGAGKILGVITLGLGVLVGGFLALRAAEALTTATAYAFITAQGALAESTLASNGGILSMVKNMVVMTLGMNRATAATEAYNAALVTNGGLLNKVSAGAKGATAAVGGVGNALKGALIGGGITLAITGIIAGLTYFAQKEAEAKQRVDDLTASLDAQTGATNGLTEAQVRQNLQADGTFKKARELGLSLNTVTQAALGNQSAIADLTAQEKAYHDAGYFANGAKRDGYEAAGARLNLGLMQHVLDGTGKSAKEVGQALLDFGDSASKSADGASDGADGADDLTSSMQDLVNTLYDGIGSTVAMQNSLSALGQSLAENGNSFDEYSAGGRANLAALQDTIATMVQASGGDAGTLAVLLQGLMSSLAGYGVNAVQQLAFVQQAIAQLTGGKGTAGMAGLTTATAAATNGLSQGFAVGTAKVEKAAKATNKTTKEIKTLTDYVSDLSNVFKTAFDIRFGLEQATSKVADGYQKIVDSAEDAQSAVDDATSAIVQSDATIQGLNAANTTLQYQLDIAKQYGDTLRAVEITAELAKNNADLADEQKARAKSQKDLTKAQQAALPSLNGQTAGSRDQQTAVLDLVQAYQDQVSALANTGLSQQEVIRRTADLKAQFIAQLTQMGYNRAEVERYAAAFDDMSAAISRVPRSITVTANTDPAQRAIDEFLAKNSNQNIGVSTSGGGGTFTPSKIAVGGGGLTTPFVNSTDLNTNKVWLGPWVSGSAAKTLLFQSKGGAVPEYHSAGGVHGMHPGGPKGTDTTPAWLTPGEFVMQKSAVQALGLPFMNALNNQQIPQYLSTGGTGARTAASGPSIQLVELLPTQLVQLANLLSTEMTLNGKVVTENTNANNVASARRGSN